MDETGWTAKERFLAVGALKIRDAARVERQLRAYRSDSGFEGRLRWASLGSADDSEIVVVQRALRMICTDVDCDFACTILDRTTSKVDDEWQSYNRLAALSIASVLDDEEVAAVLFDRFDAPASHDVAKPIRRRVNDGKGRLAVVGLQQAASHSMEGLQLVDLLLGAITYQVRETHDPKGESGTRMKLSLEVMQKHYGQTTYLRRGPGELVMNHLNIKMLPLKPRARGKRGGRRRP